MYNILCTGEDNKMHCTKKKEEKKWRLWWCTTTCLNVERCVTMYWQLVSWYFEPSQPQRATSWLKTMFNLTPIYSARKSSNHKLSINHKISTDKEFWPFTERWDCSPHAVSVSQPRFAISIRHCRTTMQDVWSWRLVACHCHAFRQCLMEVWAWVTVATGGDTTVQETGIDEEHAGTFLF